MAGAVPETGEVHQEERKSLEEARSRPLPPPPVETSQQAAEAAAAQAGRQGEQRWAPREGG